MSLLARLARSFGSQGSIWRARARLERTLADCPPSRRLSFGDVLPALDALLDSALPRLTSHAEFLRRYLNRVDLDEAREAVRRWEREVVRSPDAETRAVRERNLELACAQLERIETLTATLDRYQDQLDGLALAIDEVASRIAAARLDETVDTRSSMDRLRHDIDRLAGELAELEGAL